MPELRFATLDVFTDRPLTGNQLAIVLDAETLRAVSMQQIAREFGYAETVFITALDPLQRWARLRIFTPVRELPFAGHPLIGTAIYLAKIFGDGPVNVEIASGTLTLAVSDARKAAPQARLSLQAMPIASALPVEPDVAANLLGVPATALDLDRARLVTSGLRFGIIPLLESATLSAINAAALTAEGIARLADIDGLYCVAPSGAEHGYHARMFAPAAGVPEDAATGGAAVAFGAWLAEFGTLPFDGRIRISQGSEMGRPSLLTLELSISAERELQDLALIGQAVLISEGTLRLP